MINKDSNKIKKNKYIYKYNITLTKEHKMTVNYLNIIISNDMHQS